MSAFEKKLKQAFTLVELIVVIAIIAILSAVAYVGYTKYIDLAKQTVVKINLDSYKTALDTYQIEIATNPSVGTFEDYCKKLNLPEGNLIYLDSINQTDTGFLLLDENNQVYLYSRKTGTYSAISLIDEELFIGTDNNLTGYIIDSKESYEGTKKALEGIRKAMGKIEFNTSDLATAAFIRLENVLFPNISFFDDNGVNLAIAMSMQNGEDTLIFPQVLNGENVEHVFSLVQNIKTAILPYGLISVETNAFEYHGYLTNVVFSDTIIEIGAAAFKNTAISAIEIPANIEVISDIAFSECPNLTTVVLNEGLVNIGIGAFNGSSKLANIAIPNSVARIGEHAFDGTLVGPQSGMDISNPKYGSAVYLSNWLLGFHGAYTQNIFTMADGTSGIADYAFAYCANLTSIDNLDGLKYIGTSAFMGRYNLGSFSIPQSVVRVGKDAFSGTQIVMNTVDEGKYLDDWLIGFESGNTATAITVLDGTVGLADFSFENAHGVTKVVLPNTLKYIGFEVFSNIDDLDEINIPNTVEIIFMNAFLNCVNLTDIFIPKEVQTIITPFIGCENLTITTDADLNNLPSGWSKRWNYIG